MNILYDISTLGLVHENSIYKTGIPRVIEELAYQLAEIPECNLELCSSEHLLGSLDYAEANSRLKDTSFLYNRTSAAILKKQKNNQSVVDATSGTSRLKAKAERKLLNYLANFTNVTLNTLNTTSLRDADIYHSTFLAVPEQVKSVKSLQAFLTVYDLIPLLFPEYCDNWTKERFESIVPSIGQDTWLLSISEATKLDICNHLKVEPSRVFVTPLAADTKLFYPSHDPADLARVKEKYKVPGGPYVLSLCTIEPRKNIDHAIRCFVYLVQEQKLADLSLVLAGAKGWDYDHIFREIDGAEAIKNQIIVTGFVANENLAALYSGALVFVYPSLYEGFGLPPLEAMQCGTPVITSNTSSLPEVVGNAGIMLDPCDEDGLCQSLLLLYQDGNLRAQMAAASLARAKEFSWERCAEVTVQAYKTALVS